MDLTLLSLSIKVFEFEFSPEDCLHKTKARVQTLFERKESRA